jgi:2',3'-cyclic-nucleotide 2'-phosphodiesterase (5'-nucleotidase family)
MNSFRSGGLTVRRAFFCFSMLFWAVTAGAQDETSEKHLTVLFTTDIYGRYREVNCDKKPPSSDFANLVASIERVKKEAEKAGRPAPLTLNGGDNIGPYAFSRFLLSRGRHSAEMIAGWMKKAGYEAVALGNQDFYAVPERLAAFLDAGRAAGLAFTAANLDCQSPAAGVCRHLDLDPRRYRMFERGGLKIAVLSVIHGDLAEQTPPSHLEGLKLADPFARAREVAAAARRNGADLVIILSHLDHSETSPRNALELARRVPDADLIIANAFVTQAGQRGIGTIRFTDGATPIVGSDLFGQHLGRVELAVKREGKRWRVADLHAEEVDPSAIAPDPGLRRQLVAEQRAYCERWNRPLGAGRLSKPMDAPVFEAYLMEIMRQATRSELSFINTGLVDARTVFPLRGEITRHDVFSALPRRNRLYTFSLDAAALAALCARLSGEKSDQGDVLLIVRGLECKDTIKVNGRPLASGESYSAVTIEYLAGGMLGYFKAVTDKMKVYRPAGENRAPVLGELVRKFFQGPRFTGAEPEPIDIDLNFPDLSRKLRWSFQTSVNFNLGDTRIDNTPGYDESQLTRDEFIALKGELRGKIGAGSTLHAFSAELWMKYARSSTNGADFVESEDLTTVNLLYMLNALKSSTSGWYVPALYLSGQAETELTKPAERDFHHLELTGTAGARFALLPALEAKVGLGVRDEVFDPDSEPVFGIEIGYELARCDLFSIMGSPFQMESRFSAFFGDLGRSNTLKGQWVNRLYFALVGPIFFNVTHDLFFYRYSEKGYGLASDLTFGLSYHANTALQTF